jgi:DNA-binding IclR family transcriptional regulator
VEPAVRRQRGGNANVVSSVVRALSLLDALAAQGRAIGIAELSKRVRLHVSTVHRLLATLITRGYVRQDPETGKYALGLRTFVLGQAYLEHMDLRRAAQPALQRLAQRTGETANLVAMDREEAVYLDKAESTQSVRFFSRIGHRAPLYCTAVGKVLVADLPPEEREELLGRLTLTPLTRNTITDLGALRQELDRVAAQGYALDREECEEGASCLAAPLRDHTGRVVAALGISAPTVRLTAAKREQLIPLLVEEGRGLSQELGYQGAAAAAPAAARR